MFGVPVDEAKAKEDFKKLCDEQGVAPLLTLIKGRPKYWAAVPEGVKEYHARVLEAFPEADEYFKMLDEFAAAFKGDAADAEP